MIVDSVFFSPNVLPVIAATRSNENKPTNNQLIAPTITRIREIVRNVLMGTLRFRRPCHRLRFDERLGEAPAARQACGHARQSPPRLRAEGHQILRPMSRANAGTNSDLTTMVSS